MRGWKVVLIDGSVMSEDTCLWKNVPKMKIQTLSLLYDGRQWDLEDKEAYFVLNRSSMVPGFSGSIQVEDRGIGYYEGDTKILYTVNEMTGRFTMKKL
jgi:hypothetical protein